MEQKVICVATPLYTPDIGGPATHVALLEQNLSKERFVLRVVKFSAVRSLPKVFRHITYFFSVYKTGRSADFVYALDAVSVGFPALIAARLLAKPFVLRVGGDYAWEQGVQRFGVYETLDEFIAHAQPAFSVRVLQAFQSYVARRATVVIAPSAYLANVITMWGVPRSRIHVIYSQPEKTSFLTRSEARKKLSIREDEELVLSAGRLVPWKGFERLVDVIMQVREQRPVRAVIAGEGPERSALEKHIQHTDAASAVTLLGQLSQEELGIWIAAADIVVLNTNYEGLSHFLLEACVAGTPIISTPVGGNTELLEHGVTGLLVPYNDVGALSDAILKILTDRKFAASLTHHAAESLERFSKERAIHEIETLFTSV